MSIGRVARPASVVLAVCSSGLLLTGLLIPGLLLGTVAVGVAWLRFPAPPAPPVD